MAVFLLLYSLGRAQSLVKMEYFLDKEPGVGKGTAVSFSGPRDTILKTFQISAAGLQTGQHFVYVRIQDSGGLWSPWQMQLFFVEDTVDIGKIEQVEYFTGKDPGAGKATKQNITAGDTVKSQISRSTGGLPQGQNFIHVRAKIANGYWSPWQVQMFFIQDTLDVGKINRLEYFLDREPGPGAATTLSVSAGDTVKSQFTRTTAGLSPGRHFVHVRAKIASGYWSPWQFQMIFVEDTVQPGPIQQLEYFVNKDPGTGKGIQISIASSDTVKSTFGYSTSALSRGQHFMHVRSRSSNGLWSPWQFQMFYVETPADTGKIISYRYSIDSSLMKPAYVKTFVVSPPADTVKRTHLEKTDTALRFGRHFFRIWARQNNRLSSTWHADTFDVIDCPMLDTAAIVQAGRICVGDTLLFRQDITRFGIWSKDSFNFRWLVNGTQLSLADTFRYRHNSGDSFRLQFSFTRKRDARCKGQLEKIVKLARTPRDTFRTTICSGDSVFVHGSYRKAAGTYTFTGTSKAGCDSFSTVILKVNQKINDTAYKSICSGDSLKIHGTFRKTAGTYVFSGQTHLGCDSIVTTVLTVNPVYRRTDTLSICKGDTLKIHGRRYTAAGTYRDSFKTVKGCDSLFTTRVVVNPTYDDSSSWSICSGDSTRIHGVWRKTAGSYRFSGVSVKGCDSFSTVMLIIKPVYRYTVTPAICSGDSLKIHGTFRKTAGTYVFSGQMHLGCDSIVTTVLTVNPVCRRTDTLSICKGDTLKIHGKRYTAAGTYRDSFKTVKGCDSLFTTSVVVNPTYDDSSSRSICSGDSTRIHGVWRKTAGSYRFSGVSAKGCDSFSTVMLIINPVYRYTVTPAICSGDSLKIHGTFRKTAGTYVFSGQTHLGCDSVVTTVLTVNPVYRRTDTLSICKGDTLKIHGKRYTAAGTYRDSFKTVKGCDSLFTTRVIANDTFNLTVIRGLCGGDSIFFAGAWRKTTGNYTGRFSTVKGCDSTVILKLTVDSIIRSDDFPRICLGDSLKIGGVFRKTAGIYTDKYTAFRGCDSLVTRYLSIIPRDTTYLTETICLRGSYDFHGQLLKDTGTYKAILRNRNGCDSVVFIRIFKRAENRTVFSGTVCYGEGFFAGKGLKFGTGTFTDTLTDRFGCDSVVIYTQTERDRDTTAVSFSICEGDSVFSGSTWKKTAGRYLEILKNRFGCDSAVTSRIAVRPVSLRVIRDTICFGSTYNFLGTAISEPGLYRKILVNHVGCDSVVQLELFRRAQFVPKVIAAGFARLTTDKPYASYQWYLDRLLLNGETSRTITVSGNGVYDVSVTDSLGCGANSWDDLLGTGNDLTLQEISVFPNPVSEDLNIISGFPAEYSLYSSVGKLMEKGVLQAGRSTISVRHYSEGLYSVVIRTNDQLFLARIVVIR